MCVRVVFWRNVWPVRLSDAAGSKKKSDWLMKDWHVRCRCPTDRPTDLWTPVSFVVAVSMRGSSFTAWWGVGLFLAAALNYNSGLDHMVKTFANEISLRSKSGFSSLTCTHRTKTVVFPPLLPCHQQRHRLATGIAGKYLGPLAARGPKVLTNFTSLQNVKIWQLQWQLPPHP